ncbi:MAG: hypothetical protein ACI8ZB_004118 [Desulforhopalus sp.]|jgi:hypothetical protein
MAYSKFSYLLLLFGLVILSSCAPKTSIETMIQTSPNGARIFIDGTESLKPTPFIHTFEFDLNQEYELFAQKEGYFEEEFLLTKELPSLQDGNVTIPLSPSPLWEATTFSQATNSWIHVLVNDDIKVREAWQILLDTVVKHSPDLKEINFESGYLQTHYAVKKFDTKNGEFLLRCQLTAALISSEPLIYRIKEIAEWSGNGVQWHLYNRIFFEHDEMIREIRRRLTKK